MFDNAFVKNYLCPVTGGTVTSKYGWRSDPFGGGSEFHKGTDIGCKTGTAVLCSLDGIVIKSGWENPNNHKQGFGQRVWVQSGDLYHVYPHLSVINVSEGQKLKRGQKIGEVGSTGSSTGSHFHWQINKGSIQGETTDPAPSLQKGDKV